MKSLFVMTRQELRDEARRIKMIEPTAAPAERAMLTGRYKLVIGVLARMDRQERKEAAVSG